MHRYSGRHFSFSTYYNDFSPNFCTELGFVNRIDIRRTLLTARIVEAREEQDH